MLLIQQINLTWHKMERGAEGEKARRQFPMVYPLDERPIQQDVIVQNLNFYQHGKSFLNFVQQERLSQKYLQHRGYAQEQIQREIYNRIVWIKKHQYQFYPSVDALNLTNLSICHEKDEFHITFYYDRHRSGMPFRRGHNKDFQNLDSPFYGVDNLNEDAFVLRQNQYGQIIWNERNIDYDEGTWYYQLHIYNLFYLTDKSYSTDIFMKRKPDVTYRQLALLY